MRLVLMLVLCLSLVACGGSSDGGSDITDEELQEALLTLDDMPSGWSIAEEDGGDEDGDEENQFCNVAPIGETIDADAEAERDFTGGETGPFFTQLLAVMDEGDAETGMDRIREGFGCGEWVDEESDTTWTISEISFADLGDDTAAYRFSTIAGIFPANGNAVAIRDGGLVVMVVHVALGDIDTELTEELARKALEKAQDV